MEPKEKTLGEILYDSFAGIHKVCGKWEALSDRDKKEYEDVADAVRKEVMERSQIDHFLFEKKFHGAMELASTHMQYASDYAKERDAYIKSYNEVCQRRNELEQELSLIKISSSPIENKTAWDAEDVPALCWVRHIEDRGEKYLVGLIKPDSVVFSGAEQFYWQLLRSYEWSSDLKNWKPCTKESLQ